MNNMFAMIMQLMNSGNSPEAMLNSMMSKNPQMKVVLNQIQQSGMSPAQYLKQYATQNNIDLGPYKNLLNSKGIHI